MFARSTLALLAFVLCACAGGDDPPPTVDPNALPVSGLTTSLEDVVTDLPEERIHWQTFWSLCWDAYPNATGYEIATLTGEGTSPETRTQPGTCIRIEAAAGENAETDGLLNRDLLLALTESQLAYRVRALLPDNRATPWSEPYAVGDES